MEMLEDGYLDYGHCSEFAKIFMIIYIAKFIDKFREKINNISILCLLCIAVCYSSNINKNSAFSFGQFGPYGYFSDGIVYW